MRASNSGEGLGGIAFEVQLGRRSGHATVVEEILERPTMKGVKSGLRVLGLKYPAEITRMVHDGEPRGYVLAAVVAVNQPCDIG